MNEKETSTTSTLLLKEDALINLKGIGYWVTTIFVTLELLAGGVTDLIHGPALLFVGDPVVLVLRQLIRCTCSQSSECGGCLEPLSCLRRVFPGSKNGLMPAPSSN
jgi:hypothetical protein